MPFVPAIRICVDLKHERYFGLLRTMDTAGHLILIRFRE